MLCSQFIEFSAFLFVVFRTNPQLPANMGSDLPRKRIMIITLGIIRKYAHVKKTDIGNPFIKTHSIFIPCRLTKSHKAKDVQVIEPDLFPDPLPKPERKGVTLNLGEGG